MLPGGFVVGQTVWAASDLKDGPRVLVRGRMPGTVLGPSTSSDKSRISVQWEQLAKTGKPGSNNVRHQ